MANRSLLLALLLSLVLIAGGAWQPGRAWAGTPGGSATAVGVAHPASVPPGAPETPQAQLINGGFESGSGAGWTEYSALSLPLIVDTTTLSEMEITPRSGSWAAWLGGENSEQAYIKQQVAIDAGAPYLSFWNWIDSTESSCIWDVGKVLVNATQLTSFGLCSGSVTNGWAYRRVDLTAYVGQTVWVQLQVDTDGSSPSSLFIDDVSLDGGAPGVPGNVTISKSGTSALLNWTASGADSYEVWISVNVPHFTPGATCSGLPSCVQVTGTTYTHTGAIGDAAQQHYYRIVAVNAAGKSQPSKAAGEYDFALTK